MSGKLNIAGLNYSVVLDGQDGAATANRTFTFPEASGELALKSDAVVLQSPNGTTWTLTVTNFGNLLVS